MLEPRKYRLRYLTAVAHFMKLASRHRILKLCETSIPAESMERCDFSLKTPLYQSLKNLYPSPGSTQQHTWRRLSSFSKMADLDLNNLLHGNHALCRVDEPERHGISIHCSPDCLVWIRIHICKLEPSPSIVLLYSFMQIAQEVRSFHARHMTRSSTLKLSRTSLTYHLPVELRSKCEIWSRSSSQRMNQDLYVKTDDNWKLWLPPSSSMRGRPANVSEDCHVRVSSVTVLCYKGVPELVIAWSDLCLIHLLCDFH